RDESSATPDVETYRAVLPSLMTTQGMLIGISSPYRRSGLPHTMFRDPFGKASADVLVVKGGSTTFNPTLAAEEVAAARKDDPEAALAEWDAEFRSDLAALLGDAVIDAAIDYGRPLELPPDAKYSYRCFVDASAGRHDAFTICIGHTEGPKGSERFVADVIRG